MCFAQPKPEDWLLEIIDGPSQLGIVKSIAMDVNNDGLTDVLSASIEDGHLRAYINQGSLEFTQQFIATDVPGIFQISTVDINSDGVVDILATSLESDEVLVFESIQGFYTKRIIANKIALPTDAQSGDFNGDGMTDVVSLSYGNNQVLLHLQINPGEFATSVLAENIIGPRKIEVVDVNNDQFLDLVVVSSVDNSLRLFLNNQSAINTKYFTEILISDSLAQPRYVTSCEVNGDDFPEIIVADSAADKIIMFSSSNGLNYTASELSSSISDPGALYCQDLDQDQQQELLVVATAPGEIYWLEISPVIENILIANSRDGYLSLDVGDFDGDGVTDVLTQSFFEQRNLIYFPHFENAEAVVWEDFPEGAFAVDTGDINQDGTEDFVVASFRNDRIQWYDGRTSERHLIAAGIDGAADVVVVDLDQDGHLDVISAASNNNSFYWHRNTGSEQFITIVIFDQASFANSLAVGDINGDGELDVIGTSGSDDSVRWFNRTGMAFEPILIDNSNDAPNDVELSDMDGDGDLDLVVANFFSDDLSLCVNQENKSFQCQVISQNKGRANSVTVGDYDLDGDQDIFLSASSDNQIWLLINDLQAGEFNEVLGYQPTNPYGMATNQELIAVALPTENQVQLFNIQNLGDQPYMVIEQMVGATSVHFQSQRNYSLLMTSLQDSKLVKISLKDLIFQGQFEAISSAK